MKLKKFFQLPFSNTKYYEIKYEDETDLKLSVMELLKLLKKGCFITRIFSTDKINDVLKNCERLFDIGRGRYNYYIYENLDFLNNINFLNLRYMDIATCKKEEFQQCNLDNAIKNSPFILGFDNYLEVTNLRINVSCYTKDILNNYI